jgi:hypothetical protein
MLRRHHPSSQAALHRQLPHGPAAILATLFLLPPAMNVSEFMDKKIPYRFLQQGNKGRFIYEVFNTKEINDQDLKRRG